MKTIKIMALMVIMGMAFMSCEKNEVVDAAAPGQTIVKDDGNSISSSPSPTTFDPYVSQAAFDAIVQPYIDATVAGQTSATFDSDPSTNLTTVSMQPQNPEPERKKVCEDLEEDDMKKCIRDYLHTQEAWTPCGRDSDLKNNGNGTWTLTNGCDPEDN